MPRLLSDKDLRSLFGTVLKNASESCLRPNSYVLRLGAHGEFVNTGKAFDLSKAKKGIKIPPGHSVGITAHEELDFRRDAVHKIYPGSDLHALVSPTTDLSREGIIAPTTQVDAGFHGTLNWTLTNNASEERAFLFQERIYRITMWLLEEGERPEHLYAGDYQSKTGYVRSRRAGPPVGMKASEWEQPFVKGGPQDLLDQLISSGYPWSTLGTKLKGIDEQFRAVTDEYAAIHDSIETVTRAIDQIRERHSDTQNTVRTVLREEVGSLQNRWLIGAGSLLVGTVGLVLTTSTSPPVWTFLREYGAAVGIVLFVLAAIGLFIVGRQK